jgi:hypothetical protein
MRHYSMSTADEALDAAFEAGALTVWFAFLAGVVCGCAPSWIPRSEKRLVLDVAHLSTAGSVDNFTGNLDLF